LIIDCRNVSSAAGELLKMRRTTQNTRKQKSLIKMASYRINGLTLFDTIFCNRDDFSLSPPTIMLSNEIFVKFELYGEYLGALLMTFFQDQHGHVVIPIPSHFKLKEWYGGKWKEVTKKERCLLTLKVMFYHRTSAIDCTMRRTI